MPERSYRLSRFSFTAPLLVAFLAAGCDGTQPIRIPSAVFTDIDPVWSPQGTLVAFEHRQGDALDADGQPIDAEIGGLYLAAADGSDRRLLVANAGAAAWSPDGRYVLYDRYPGLHIFQMDLETGVETQLTFGDNWNRFPAWSPAGDIIAFDSNRDVPSGQSYLHVMAADGSESRRLTPASDSTGEETTPSFSPDGRKIAYGVAVSGCPTNAGGWQIFAIDISGGAPAKLATGMYPSWGPGGDWIVYLAVSRSGVTSLRLIRPDGTGDRLLYSESRGAAGWPGGRPAWTPDGAWVVFSARTGNAFTLWAIRPDGTGLRQITSAVPK